MRKKHKSDRTLGTFRNNPFHSLSGMSPRRQPRSNVASAKTISDEEVDDAGLFERAVRDVRPMARGEEQAEAAVSRPKEKALHDAGEVNDNRLFLQAMTALGTATVRERVSGDEASDADGPRRSASGRMRQLKKGTIRIARELDLHGSLRDEAIRKLQHFVAGAYARGDQAVLVITGKGINSPDGPVLPAAVSTWLAGPGRGMVSEFFQAPRDKGGSGAVVVFLRRKK